MKRLLLLRHAKAEQTSGHGDHGRTLTARGRRDAPAMGRAMRERGLIPDRVLCSGARRTRDTWDLVAAAFKSPPGATFSDTLYLAPWKTILSAVRTTDDAVKTLLVVGHNPGLEECAAALLRAPQSEEERGRADALREKFPTAALAVLDCDIDRWNALAPGQAAFTEFLRPRALDD